VLSGKMLLTKYYSLTNQSYAKERMGNHDTRLHPKEVTAYP
jgi:hypothetical protein